MGSRRTDDEVELLASPARPAVLHPFRALHLGGRRAASATAAAKTFARPYSSAAARLRRWQAAGDLVAEREPALYLHEFTAQGLRIRGLVGALDLSSRATSLADRAVLPHEAIHVDQAEALAAGMLENALNPAPILLAHRGTTRSRCALDRITSTHPWQSFSDRAGQQHRIWQVTNPSDLQDVLSAVETGPLLLADGHHRYAAYLRLQERHGGGWDRGLAMVVDQEDTPLFLGAIHRVLHGASLPRLAEAADAVGASLGRGTETSTVASLAPGTLVATDGREWLSINTEDLPAHRSTVEDLHALILPRLDQAPAVTFHHTVQDALGELRGDGVAVLLPAPSYDLVDRTLREGRLLPEKATSFQPKPSVGVLMRTVEDD